MKQMSWEWSNIHLLHFYCILQTFCSLSQQSSWKHRELSGIHYNFIINYIIFKSNGFSSSSNCHMLIAQLHFSLNGLEGIEKIIQGKNYTRPPNVFSCFLQKQFSFNIRCCLVKLKCKYKNKYITMERTVFNSELTAYQIGLVKYFIICILEFRNYYKL